MKKSLLVTYFFPPKIGGIENYLKNLCLKLPADQIIILTDKTESSDNYDRKYPRKVIRQKIFAWRFFKPSWLPLIWRIRKILKNNNIKCLQFGHYFNGVTAGLILKKIYGIPYIVYTHGVDTLIPQKGWFVKKLMIKNLKNADYVIANTRFMKKKIMELGVFESQIAIVYPSLLLENTKTLNGINELKKKLNLQNSKVLLTIGRLIKRKGQDYVIRAMPGLIKKYPNLKYLIVGDGPDKEYLLNMAKDSGVADKVIFAGPVKDEDVLKLPYYRLADLFIMPTRAIDDQKDVESFGLVYLEAQSQGLPVIVGRAGGTRETIIEEETGFSVDATDIQDIEKKVDRILNDEKLRKKMGEKARKWVRGTFNWDTQIKKIYNIINPPVVFKKDEETPAVSLVIPAYRTNNYIINCLESIRKQTFKDYEVIVVNDGPDKELANLVKSFDRQIKIIERVHEGDQPNQAAAVRNLGAGSARGKYLYFCDADITLYPLCLEKMVRALEFNLNYDFCYAAFIFGRNKFRALDFSSERLKKFNYISTMSLVRAEKFPGFDEKLARFQDWDLWLQLSKNGSKGLPIRDVLFKGPLRKEGISKSISESEAVRAIKNKYNL